jgi:nucleoside-triphosphatase
MISREAREGSVRVGFEIIDLTNNRRGWLAHVNQKIGPQIGKYRVNLEDLERIGATAIMEATGKNAVVVVDEIGPMELFSQRFKQAVRQALNSEKPVLAVIHGKAQDPLISYAKQRNDAMLFTVNLANREVLPETLSKQTATYLSGQQVI